MDKNKKDNSIAHEDDVTIDSFEMYPSSDEDNTKIVDGEPVIEDFHMYKEKEK